MEDQESLKTCALVGQFPDPIQHEVNDFFADRVVAPSIVVGRILFTGDQLFRVEKLSVGSGSNLVC